MNTKRAVTFWFSVTKLIIQQVNHFINNFMFKNHLQDDQHVL